MSTQYQIVTDRIVSMLETGTRPWAQGWNAAPSAVRPRRVDGTPYRGMNVLNLWAASTERGFASPFWMTYKAAQAALRSAQSRKEVRADFAGITPYAQALAEYMSLSGPWAEDGGEFAGLSGFQA